MFFVLGSYIALPIAKSHWLKSRCTASIKNNQLWLSPLWIQRGPDKFLVNRNVWLCLTKCQHFVEPCSSNVATVLSNLWSTCIHFLGHIVIQYGFVPACAINSFRKVDDDKTGPRVLWPALSAFHLLDDCSFESSQCGERWVSVLLSRA